MLSLRWFVWLFISKAAFAGFINDQEELLWTYSAYTSICAYIIFLQNKGSFLRQSLHRMLCKSLIKLLIMNAHMQIPQDPGENVTPQHNDYSCAKRKYTSCRIILRHLSLFTSLLCEPSFVVPITIIIAASSSYHIWSYCVIIICRPHVNWYSV